jgi:broad specificity phosphatase PhoE
MPFYLIRHGESEANVARITAGGQLDSPLTALGRSQPVTLAPYLTQLEIQPGALYHSNMQRARDTALALNETWCLPAVERADLREHDMGNWDGLPWEDVYPHLESGISPPGGESERDFSIRIKSAITDILTIAPAHPPVIVAHGGLFNAIGFLYSYAMSHVQNCHLHYFEPHPEYALFPWRVVTFDIEGDRLVKRPAEFCWSVR